MELLIVINDAPYGSERPYNAIRMANQINKDYPEANVTIFLMADAVVCGLPNQNTPNGYYNIERMLKLSINKGAKVLLSGSCLDARGLTEVQFINGCFRSTMPELTKLVMESDKVINF